MSVLDRYWQYVNRGGSDDCWPWLGGRNDKGYGQFTLNHRKSGRQSNIGAHVFVLTLATGVLPADRLAMHWKCDNPPCCNPAHLRWGTRKDNAQDMIRKGRGGGHRYQPGHPQYNLNHLKQGSTK